MLIVLGNVATLTFGISHKFVSGTTLGRYMKVAFFLTSQPKIILATSLQ